MSFSLNIFVPDDDLPEANDEGRKVTSTSNSKPSLSKVSKATSTTTRTPTSSLPTQTATKLIPSNPRNSKPGAARPIPTVQSSFAGVKAPDSEVEDTVKSLLAGTKEAESPKVQTETANEPEKHIEENEGKHSRKHPEARPRPRAGLTLIRQVRAAPTSEAPTSESDHIFAPVEDFKGIGLNDDISEHVLQSVEEKGLGLAKPTRVQAQTIPILLSGRDCLVKSETGSGKTLSYILPILDSLLATGEGGTRVSRGDGLYALILSPTRELCLQIFDVLAAASRPFHWIVSTCIVGGEKKKSEKQRLRKGVNIIVATPGRLADHLRTTNSLRDSLYAHPLRWLVLDEADRLLDSGFEKQVQEILDTLIELREGRDENPTQTVLLSATITQQVEKLAGLALRAPERVMVEREKIAPKPVLDENGERRVIDVVHQPEQQDFVTPKQLVQHYLLVESGERLVALAAYIRRHVRRTGNTCKTLVFVASRAVAEFLHALFAGATWPPVDPQEQKKGKKRPAKISESPGVSETEAMEGRDEQHASEEALVEGLGTKWYLLHGSVDQKDRKRTIREFGSAKGGVLICTDVAARGLDLPQVDLVVQYDPPSEVSEYVHRAGRTARSGRRGTAIIFLREAELQYLEILKQHGLELSPVKMTYESLMLPPLIDPATGKRKANQPELALDAEVCRTRLQGAFEDRVAADPELQDSARKAYLSWVGAYAVHSSETKHIFVTRELHFGHVARSFALKEPPAKIKQHFDEAASKKALRQEIDDRRNKKARKELRRKGLSDEGGAEDESGGQKSQGSASKKRKSSSSKEENDPASLMRKKARHVVSSMRSEFEA